MKQHDSGRVIKVAIADDHALFRAGVKTALSVKKDVELIELEKLCAIMESGRLMAQKLEPETRIFLYRMQTFYVSACYSIETDQLTEITAYIDVEESMPHFRKFLISIHPAERQYDTPEF